MMSPYWQERLLGFGDFLGWSRRLITIPFSGTEILIAGLSPFPTTATKLRVSFSVGPKNILEVVISVLLRLVQNGLYLIPHVRPRHRHLENLIAEVHVLPLPPFRPAAVCVSVCVCVCVCVFSERVCVDAQTHTRIHIRSTCILKVAAASVFVCVLSHTHTRTNTLMYIHDLS